MSELNTRAEHLADASRQLPGFKNLSLPGIKEQISAILSLIGRNGIFSTYTVHDITHVDAMLKMLDWLVPESTAKVMTSVDWLLTVLAIYLHDLGLVTTEHEYEARSSSPEFNTWREGLARTDDGREYLARTNRMSSSEKERFFFQEFVRKGHALRIREWITGRHTRSWPPEVEPIAAEVANLLAAAPSRFRDYLGIVCESHDTADLDRLERYPLAMRFGNEPQEIGNVQYAGVLLRTADLLHVTKDRTPSVMYKTIRFSDPKSVEEWNKQVGTFAVGPRGRQLVEGDPESAVIVINADFTEERPLFSLQEYIAYADSEIRQSKRWIEKSQESPDARYYSFPWHDVVGDVRLEGVPPQPMRFEMDRGQLLDLLVGHTIYNEPTVAVRELLQNGIDAVRYQRYLDLRQARLSKGNVSPWGTVIVQWDPKTRRLIIQDDGIGMDRDVIQHHLMSVGSSYYNTPQFEQENQEFVPISRFGIGILTCFMVSDDVEIVTFNKAQGHRIRMTSVKSTYLLRELEPGNHLLEGLEPHGTRVTLRVRDTVDLTQLTVLDIVKHWVVLPECTVEYREVGEKPVRIGFNSVADALQNYLKSADAISPSGEEIVVKSRSGASGLDFEGESYDLAFAVISGYFPERSFARQLNPGAPRVCIEGVRVAQYLPGFEGGREQLRALLSVRGSRKFRTTVSRAGLEIDDEYLRVSRLCGDMFFEHIQDEARRISGKNGRPLSQAASGCQYLVRQLRSSSFGNPAFAEYLDAMAEEQPMIVVENVKPTSDKPITSRALICARQLREIQEFWTIESRSVDSLGTISLDLGRELSLNEFLVALAPEVTQLRYFPLVSDAQRSREAVCASHCPELVEFSRQHQQTAIKWTCRKNGRETELSIAQTASKEFFQALLNARRELDRDPGYRFRDDLGRSIWRHEIFSSLYLARVTGDDGGVKAVATRMGSIIDLDSDIARFLETIRKGVIEIVSQGKDLRAALCALNVAAAFEAFLSPLRSPYSREADMIWPDQFPRFRDVLGKLGARGDLPVDLRDRLGPELVYNATSFWRDWDRRD